MLIGMPFPLIFAQTLTGQIIDIQDGRPLGQVMIRTLDSSIVRYSQSDGRFEFPMPAEKTRWQFYRLGYESQEVEIDPHRSQILISPSPESVSLSEVRVTAYSTSRSNRETAGAIAVIRGEQIRQGNGISLQSAFNCIPGVQMDQSNLSESRISIRGQGIRAPWGIRNVKIYLNEIPISEADGTSRLEAIDVQNLGSAEIMKGPASSLYGGGTGGVIRFQLQRAAYQE